MRGIGQFFCAKIVDRRSKSVVLRLNRLRPTKVDPIELDSAAVSIFHALICECQCVITITV